MKEDNSKKGFPTSTIGIASLIFLGVLMLMFMVGITIRPICGKSSEGTFTFKNKMEKDYILERIEEVINSTYITNVARQNREEYNNVITYSTGNKVLDYIIQPIKVRVDKDFVVVVASKFFINEIRKVLR